jgi:hypothetical protein
MSVILFLPVQEKSYRYVSLRLAQNAYGSVTYSHEPHTHGKLKISRVTLLSSDFLVAQNGEVFLGHEIVSSLY